MTEHDNTPAPQEPVDQSRRKLVRKLAWGTPVIVALTLPGEAWGSDTQAPQSPFGAPPSSPVSGPRRPPR
jgi:hypothetical protein